MVEPAVETKSASLLCVTKGSVFDFKNVEK